MVVIRRPSTSTASIKQAVAGTPSISTVHAPQKDAAYRSARCATCSRVARAPMRIPPRALVCPLEPSKPAQKCHRAGRASEPQPRDHPPPLAIASASGRPSLTTASSSVQGRKTRSGGTSVRVRTGSVPVASVMCSVPSMRCPSVQARRAPRQAGVARRASRQAPGQPPWRCQVSPVARQPCD